VRTLRRRREGRRPELGAHASTSSLSSTSSRRARMEQPPPHRSAHAVDEASRARRGEGLHLAVELHLVVEIRIEPPARTCRGLGVTVHGQCCCRLRRRCPGVAAPAATRRATEKDLRKLVRAMAPSQSMAATLSIYGANRRGRAL
jgi:hypothetical protein